MAVLAPMPTARVSMATVANPGFLSSWRMANFRSFMAQGVGGMNAGGATGWNETRRQRHSHQDEGVGRVDERICGRDSEEHALKEVGGEEGAEQSEGDAEPGGGEPFAEHQLQDVTALRADGHADAQLARALAHRV